MTRILNWLVCLCWGHGEALHYGEDNGKLYHVATVCLQCGKQVDFNKALR